MPLVNDEKKFVVFWIGIFSSAIGFWVVVVHWVWDVISS